jgi:2-oxo-hept-3-ene-1,7-dioate hydratase
MLSKKIRQQAADSLYAADKARRTIAQLSKTYEGIELADAYAIQQLWLDKRIKDGAKLVGRKIGLTSRAMQMASNFTEPDYGYLTDDMLIADGAQIETARYVNPRLEVELAFIMGSDLQGAGCQVADVMRATEFVTPALELIAYRTLVPRAIVDTIADNAAAGAMVTGGRLVRPFDLDVRWVGATLSKNGMIEESGVSAAVMGHPAAGIAWLVNKLALHGSGLKKGQIVLGGSFTRPVSVAAGDVIMADYGPLGSLGVRFV